MECLLLSGAIRNTMYLLNLLLTVTQEGDGVFIPMLQMSKLRPRESLCPMSYHWQYVEPWNQTQPVVAHQLTKVQSPPSQPASSSLHFHFFWLIYQVNCSMNMENDMMFCNIMSTLLQFKINRYNRPPPLKRLDS